MKQKVLITSALLYANGQVHFGHIAGAYLPADCYARYRRLLGDDVLFISGSDEYGVAISLSAEIAKRTPKEHIDHFDTLNRKIFERLQISFDHFSRTSWEGHTETTIEFFNTLNEKGLIEKKEENHLYSNSEKRFLADRYVIGICPKCGFEEARGDECPACGASYEATDLKNPRSKLNRQPLVMKPSEHWYFRFDFFKERLDQWLSKKTWKNNVVNFVKSYLKDLRPRAITRDADWGISVPLKEAKGKVFYVWFDAPIGYISATKQWAKQQNQPEKWKEFWLNEDTEYITFIGKDNIPFHAIFFPAMLMGMEQGYKLTDELPANEFLMYEGKQFSKSEGWYIDLNHFLDRYSVDQARYCLAANAPENNDAEFTWKDFQSRCNAELLSKFGNLVHRILTFAKQHCASKVPKKGTLNLNDEQFLQDCKSKAEEMGRCFHHFELRKAASMLMELASIGNVYFDEEKPWGYKKNPHLKERMQTVIYCCLQCLKFLAFTSFPILPNSSQKIWTFLGMHQPIDKYDWEGLLKLEIPSGQNLKEPEILFQKVEDEAIIEEISKLGTISAQCSIEGFHPLKDPVEFGQFEQLDLRVAEIISAERLVKSKKLMKLVVDLGFEKRNIVSGIAHAFEPNQLIGKKIVLLANLVPRNIMGIESQGMILAGSLEKQLELPEIQNLKPGSIVS